MSHSQTENVQSLLYNINMSLYISLYSIPFRWSPEGPVSQNHTPHLHVPRWCPWDLFRPIKICLDAKESGVRKATEATAPIQSLVKLQSLFLSLRWKTCLRHNCSLVSGACSEGPALGQNTNDILLYYIKHSILRYYNNNNKISLPLTE